MQGNRSKWISAALLAATACGPAQPPRPAEYARDGGAVDSAIGSDEADIGDPFLDASPGVSRADAAAEGGAADASACLDDGCTGAAFNGDPGAVFVAPTGMDTAAGTMTAPVRTIGKAIGLAQTAHKDVYVCDGTYAEAVIVAKTAVSLHGGYDCAHGWQPVEDRATIAPVAGIPLSVQSVASMTIDGIDLVAPDGVKPSDSSIAALVANSTHIGFRHVTFTAGAGSSGLDGAPNPGVTTDNQAGASGSAFTASPYICAGPGPGAACDTPPAGGSTAAAQAPSCGGAGGRGGDGQNAHETVARNLASAGSPAGLGGGVTSTGGLPGLPGVMGAAGVGGKSGIGTLSASGYIASNAGTTGSSGAAGGGGGGGAGGLEPLVGGDLQIVCAVATGGGGGQGGYGGCGGAGGQGGGGGGASIGLLSFESEVSLTACTVSPGPGGPGGSPSAGAPGQLGGAGGPGAEGTLAGTGPNCPATPGIATNPGHEGGPGGPGGTGGAGGPGGGGPSFGIAWVGTAPAVDATVTINLNQGGAGGVAITGSNGADGLFAPIYPPDDTADAGADQ